METSANLIERLKPICLDESEYVRKSYEGIKEPFSYERDGVRYVGATDGRLAVFVASDDDAPPCPVNFQVIFDKMQAEPLTVNLAALKEFCGKPVSEWFCNCPDCEETHAPEQRRGLIGGVLFDLNILAHGLAVVPEGECSVSLNGPESPIFLHGKEWWITLMPMKKRGDERDLPKFDL